MYLTLETDYAVRIMENLFLSQTRVDAKKIAEETRVTLRFALKILRKLVAAKVVKSYKGVKGGYEVCVKPNEVSLYDILYIIEGEYVFSRCLLEKNECAGGRGKHCKVRNIYNKLTLAVRDELKTATFDKIM